MYEIVSVQGNSVRVRRNGVTLDVLVTIDAKGKKSILLPEGAHVDNFRLLVAKVLDAYEKIYGK